MTATAVSLRESNAFVEKEALVEARYFAGYMRYGRVALGWQELNDQHGPRHWAQHKEKIPDAEKPKENRLTLRGALLFMLLSGCIFTMAESSIAAVALLLDDLQAEEERRLLEQYRQRSAFNPTGKPELLKIFRSVPNELAWEKVPGTDRLRLTASLTAIVRMHHLEHFPSATKNHEQRYVRSILERPLFVHGMASVALALRRRFGHSGGDEDVLEGAEEAARVQPYLDVEKLRCDFFAFNLFVRSCDNALSGAIVGVDAACAGLVDMGDVQMVLETLRLAVANLDDPDAQRQLQELGVTAQSQRLAFETLERELREARENFEERLSEAEKAAQEASSTAMEASSTARAASSSGSRRSGSTASSRPRTRSSSRATSSRTARCATTDSRSKRLRCSSASSPPRSAHAGASSSPASPSAPRSPEGAPSTARPEGIATSTLAESMEKSSSTSACTSGPKPSQSSPAAQTRSTAASSSRSCTPRRSSLVACRHWAMTLRTDGAAAACSGSSAIS